MGILSALGAATSGGETIETVLGPVPEHLARPYLEAVATLGPLIAEHKRRHDAVVDILEREKATKRRLQEAKAELPKLGAARHLGEASEEDVATLQAEIESLERELVGYGEANQELRRRQEMARTPQIEAEQAAGAAVDAIARWGVTRLRGNLNQFRNQLLARVDALEGHGAYGHTLSQSITNNAPALRELVRGVDLTSLDQQLERARWR